jgi:hypothetical protein
MKIRLLSLPLALLLLAGITAVAQPEENNAAPSRETLPEFNQIVLNLIDQYPADGTHGYWWPRSGESDYSGGTRDLMFQGQRVMKGEPKQRTFCCGLTLEVFLRSYQDWLKDRGGEKAAAFTADEWKRFMKLWFVQKTNGPGPSAALEAFDLGKEIKPAEVLPGDFVQIWRTENKKGKISGHSVIFLRWVYNDDNDVIGFEYWSTQPGTDGISKRIEYYGPLGGMSTEYTYFGRVEPRAKAGEDTGS